jgi:hypothetical protein
MLKRMQGVDVDEDEEEANEAGKVDMEEMDEEQLMAKLMGFEGFDTTKGQKIEDNHSTAARGAMAKTKRREYKQVSIFCK